MNLEFLSDKPLLITDTILRDAHQSQAATRMTIEDMLPALEILDSIGYYSLECWGGATFDSLRSLRMTYLGAGPCCTVGAIHESPAAAARRVFRCRSLQRKKSPVSGETGDSYFN